MRKKMYWGLASLILIIGVVGVYFMLQPEPDPEVEKKFIVPSEADLKKASETKKPPREAKDGFTWEWHADHWHEVPVVQNDPPLAHPDTVQPKQHAIDAAGEVIYPHHELLQRHPVAALRAQAKDNGHWSARYIPPFPPDDAEANELAQAYYIDNYFKSRNDFYNPVASKARQVISEWRNNNSLEPGNYKKLRPRHWDLVRLSWTRRDPGSGEFAWTNLHWEIESNFTWEEYDNANTQ